MLEPECVSPQPQSRQPVQEPNHLQDGGLEAILDRAEKRRAQRQPLDTKANMGRTRWRKEKSWDRASSESVELVSNPRAANKAEPRKRSISQPTPTRPYTAYPDSRQKNKRESEELENEDRVLSIDDLPQTARGVSRLLKKRSNPKEPTPPPVPRGRETTPPCPNDWVTIDETEYPTTLSLDGIFCVTDPSSKSGKSRLQSSTGESKESRKQSSLFVELMTSNKTARGLPEEEKTDEKRRKVTPPTLNIRKGSSTATLVQPQNVKRTPGVKPEPSVEGIRANIDEYCAQKKQVSPHDETLNFQKAGYSNSPRKISTSYKGHRIERFYSDLRTRGELVCWCLDANRLKMRVDKARLVRDGNGEKRTEYRLTVRTLEHRWHIWYRYSDFKQLDEHMCEELEDNQTCQFPGAKRRPSELEPFPKGVWLGKNSENVQRDRIRGFNEYINGFLKNPSIITDNFIKFICQSAYISAKI